MIFDRSEQHPGARFLFFLACLVVVVWGMKMAAPILLPMALALFLTVLSMPVMFFLRRHGFPGWLATALTVLMTVGVFGLLVLVASGSLSELQEQIPVYATRLSELQETWIHSLEVRFNVPLGDYLTLRLVDPAAMVDLAGMALGRIAQIVSLTFLVFLITIFMLGEAKVFPDKVRYLFGEAIGHEDRLEKVVGEIQTYLGIKTVISLATGIIVGIWCYLLKLDFPVLLGLVAFMLNYVPTVGSVIAAAPAVLLSLVLYGSFPHALAVVSGYLVVNLVLGNILEPNLMGRRLGLSTLVVVLSLLFWGWAWGPLGALLSVPLTVVVKIWAENTRDLRWVAVLIDTAAPRALPPGGALSVGGAAPPEGG
jgi:predicted PurR-regulated permease PerM